MKNLNEDMHPLITPQFGGTAEEITTALRCWADLIENLRFLDVRVTAYINRSKIIDHLERELAALRAEIDNTSASITNGELGQMKQTIPGDSMLDKTESASDTPVAPVAPVMTQQEAHAAKYVAPQATPTRNLGSAISNFNATR